MAAGPELRTERLVLRRWRDADREPFAVMNVDPEVVRYLPGPLTRAESDALADRIEAHFAERGHDEVVSFTVPANRASRAVMERLGMMRDPDGDFDHPRLPPDNPLRRRVLYRLTRNDWERGSLRPSGGERETRPSGGERGSLRPSGGERETRP